MPVRCFGVPSPVYYGPSHAAGVVELVDAPDSKSGASDGVRVRVPPSAPIDKGKKTGPLKGPVFLLTSVFRTLLNLEPVIFEN